jgi:hypothetical protein
MASAGNRYRQFGRQKCWYEEGYFIKPNISESELFIVLIYTRFATITMPCPWWLPRTPEPHLRVSTC